MSEGGLAQGIFGALHGAEEIGKGALGLWEGEGSAWSDLGAGAGDLFHGGLQAAMAGSEYAAGKIPGLDALTGLIGVVGGTEKAFEATNEEQRAEGIGQATFGGAHVGLGLAEDAVAALMAADAAATAGAAGAGAAATLGTGGFLGPVAAMATAAGLTTEGLLAGAEFGLTAADVAVSGTEMGLDLVGGLTGMGSANSIVGGLEMSLFDHIIG